MFKHQSKKTLLLGISIILVTFTTFVSLPAVLPLLDSINIEEVTWACTRFGMTPEKQDTWIWINAEQPDEDTWVKTHAFTYHNDDIRNGLHKLACSGAFNFKLAPESIHQIVIDGYLQYGIILDFEGDALECMPEQPEILSFECELYNDVVMVEPIRQMILKQFPVPFMKGIMPKRTINVSINHYYPNKKTTETYQVMTDNSGHFSKSLNIDINALYYDVVVFFESEIIIPDVIETSMDDVKAGAKYQVEIKPPQLFFETFNQYTTQQTKPLSFSGPNYIRVLWVFGVFIVVLVLVIIKHHSNNVKYSKIKDVVESEVPPINTKKGIHQGTEIHEVTRSFTITFPDIECFLPLIWGVTEQLQINVQLDELSYPLQTYQIDWNDKEIPQAILYDKNTTELFYIYAHKGEYTITARYQDKSGKEFSSWRKIRIVDYREEMVRLFGEMLEELNLEDREITRDLTPREVERLLSERLKNVSKESLRRVIDGFEEANYSTHPVNRESYVRMYRAIREVRGKG